MIMRIRCLTLLWLLSVVAQTIQAAPLKVENVRVWAAPDGTRVVFDISEPAQYRITRLTDNYRAVIDIKDAIFESSSAQPAANDKYLQKIRAAMRNGTDLRIVLDLKKYAQSKSFQLPPNKHYGHRLVIDLFDQQQPRQPLVQAKPVVAAPARLRDVIIAIDAGHGGEDPGARGPNGTLEKDVVLQISKKLMHRINNQRGMAAVLIRESDYFMRLQERINKARQYRADLLISLHADAFQDPKVRGSSVYVLSQKGASSAAAKWLADQENAADLIGGVSLDDKDDLLKTVLLDLSQTASLEASVDAADRVLKGLRGVGKVHKRHVQSAGFAVLKSPDVPSILIETAFISNPSEEKKLLSVAHQNKLVGAIVKGLNGYFREFAPAGSILASREHTIVRGDTLSGIAQQYRINLEQLRRFNRIDGNFLRVGQVISIPGSGDT